MKTFDWESFLDDHGIDYITSGHEHCTSSFKYQTHCPISGVENYHLGLNPTGNACFKCGRSHSLYELLEAWLHRTDHDLKKLMGKYGSGKISAPVKSGKALHGNNELMRVPVLELTKQHQKYLSRRGFNTEQLKIQYKIQSIMPIGKFGGRIYIPVYQNRKEVCFTTRSTQIKGHAKYTHCYDDKSIVPIKDCLYGLDDCKNDHVVLVEGVTDVWNIGTDTVCMFGKTLSDIQKRLLVKRFKTIFVLLDPDAFKQSKQIKTKLSPYRKTICLALKDKDPGELTKQEVYELLNTINQLKGK